MAQILKNIRGHRPQLETLLNAKKNERLAHALLFTGLCGIGRREVALALAQTLLCEKRHPACGECSSCISVERENSQHILCIQPDGLYIKVDAIRQISRFLSLQSFAPARIIIIDSAHQMNLQAANSLLKILEEPPNHVYFILISSHLSALPVTIRSRVQTLRFLPLKPADMRITVQMSRKKKKIKQESLTEEEEEWLIRASQGSMDNLEKLKENTELRNQAFELLKKAVLGRELFPFGELADLVKKRDQALFVCLCWQQILRDAYMMKLKSENTVIHQDQQDILSILKKIPFGVLDIFFQETIQLEQDLKGYLDSPLAFDNLFMQIKERTGYLEKEIKC